jgi:hypothetical protein
MTDHKPDSLNATGMHRAWVGESVASVGAARALPPRDAAPRNWTNRPQGNSRHAAITKGLSNFPNYKSWTEKVKTNWEKDKEPQK